MAKNHSNKELDLAWNYLQNTQRNVFLTGNAGTGKTTFLRKLKEKSHKRIVVCAPTGVAAINAGGVTLHSFFQLPFGPLLMERVTGKRPTGEMAAFKFNKKKINIIKTLDLLVIDEISMVRADMLDAIDDILRKYRNPYRPFGGIQVLMIGDLEQLSPVIKNNEWELLRPYYTSIYFFHARVMKEAQLQTIELKHIYRQADHSFIKILNEIRNNCLSQSSIEQLNERYQPDFSPEDGDEYIMLTTHNATADDINQKHLNELPGKPFRFKAKVQGIFNENSYPADYELQLKEDAQVMFIKNDSSFEKRYYNGKIGKITHISPKEIQVLSEGDEKPIYVEREEWNNTKYELDSKSGELKEESLGTFAQYPLRLAWAITIHKSQGLTFERAQIDAQAAFAHGQTYVALSRCKSLEGLVLTSKIQTSSIISDQKVSRFNEEMKANPPTEENLKQSVFEFQLSLIEDIFSYKQWQYRIQRLEATVFQHRRVVMGKLLETLTTIKNEHLPNWGGVAAKFLQQVNQLASQEQNLEHNKALQERIQKAAHWFHQEHEQNIHQQLKIGFETDNKEVRKQISEQLETLLELIFIRQAMLESCKKGFKIESILKARTEAALKAAKESKPSQKASIKSDHPELLSLLRFWRRACSDVRMQAESSILSYKSMVEISNKLPQSLNALKKVRGIGKVKVQEYGEELVELVKEYLESNEIKIEEPEEEKPKAKVKTHELTWNLLSAGKSMQEAADERNLALTTIESHVLKCVDKTDFNFSNFIDKEKLIQILDFFHDHPESTTSEAKSELGDDVSWFELRLVNIMRTNLSKSEAQNTE
jgi:citrate lyase gamma subunit